MIRQHTIEIRVRYQETDAQGRVHHATYINYFEMGRVELLRAAGYSYRDLERQGFHLVVAQLECRYFGPAEYDDVLQLTTMTRRAKGARIFHEYELFREDVKIVEGSSVVACVDRKGNVCRLPEWMRLDEMG